MKAELIKLTHTHKQTKRTRKYEEDLLGRRKVSAGEGKWVKEGERGTED